MPPIPFSQPTPQPQHKFYFKDAGPYPPPGRATQDIIADLTQYATIPGVQGQIGQLTSAQSFFNEVGAQWTENLLMGRKFEAERTIFFARRNALERTNSTASGYDLIARNFAPILYIQVKWSNGPMPSSTINDVVREARTHPSGTYLVESNNIDLNARTKLRQNGGEELPFPYP